MSPWLFLENDINLFFMCCSTIQALLFPFHILFFFFFQAEDGIRDAQESRGLGDVYKRQVGDDAALKLLLQWQKQQIDLHSVVNARQSTLLHHAVEAARIDCVKWLIERNFDPDLPNDNTQSARALSDINKVRGAHHREVHNFLGTLKINTTNDRRAKRQKRVAAQKAQYSWEGAIPLKSDLTMAKQDSLVQTRVQPPRRAVVLEDNCPEAERLLTEWSSHCSRIIQLTIDHPDSEEDRMVLKSSLDLVEVIAELLRHEKQQCTMGQEGETSQLLQNLLAVLRLEIPILYSEWLEELQSPPKDLCTWALSLFAIRQRAKDLDQRTQGAVHALQEKNAAARAKAAQLKEKLAQVEGQLNQIQVVADAEALGRQWQEEVARLEVSVDQAQARANAAMARSRQAEVERVQMEQALSQHKAVAGHNLSVLRADVCR
eukprot:TRINITY_DN24629_c0_g1_i6.p1 TRINITY_DN24629_c0_g1~~TRINITY_DN24629_c0_g1_i6.p1  ORF type:complete len:432 (+),score=136.77 TRINITY_DN24629_c0_g1_i6:2-1297(+)